LFLAFSLIVSYSPDVVLFFLFVYFDELMLWFVNAIVDEMTNSHELVVEDLFWGMLF